MDSGRRPMDVGHWVRLGSSGFSAGSLSFTGSRLQGSQVPPEINFWPPKMRSRPPTGDPTASHRGSDLRLSRSASGLFTGLRGSGHLRFSSSLSDSISLNLLISVSLISLLISLVSLSLCITSLLLGLMKL
jgi:hypothetical protein